MEEPTREEIELHRVPRAYLPYCGRCMQDRSGICFIISVRTGSLYYLIGESKWKACCRRYVREIRAFDTEWLAEQCARSVSFALALGQLSLFCFIEIEPIEVALAT